MFNPLLIIKLATNEAIEFAFTNQNPLFSLHWTKPHYPYFKLNCDGSARNNLKFFLNNTQVLSHHRIFPLIKNCRCLLSSFEQATVKHIFREANYSQRMCRQNGVVILHALTLSLILSPFISNLCFYDFIAFNYLRNGNFDVP